MLALEDPQSLSFNTEVTIAQGASVQLNQSGAIKIRSLTLNGTTLSPGVYGAADFPAYLSGPGSLDTRSNPNPPPVLTPLSDRTMGEGSLLNLTLTATDDNPSAQSLTFGLASGPSGLTVTANGVVNWTPTEVQGPSTAVVRVFVSDGLASVASQFNVVVREVNQPPTLLRPSDQTVEQGTVLNLALAATDNDLPAQPLTFGLAGGGPVGLTVTADGLVSWAPAAAQAPSTNVVRVLVSDGFATATNQFTIVVRQVSTAPLFIERVTLSGGIPTFTFPTVSGNRYRLLYRNELVGNSWLTLIRPPQFSAPDGWSAQHPELL